MPDDATNAENFALEKGDRVPEVRLKYRCVKAFLAAAHGRGLDICLNVLLQMATADGKEGRPWADPRTRKNSAESYVKSCLETARLEMQAKMVEPAVPSMQDNRQVIFNITREEIDELLSTADGRRIAQEVAASDHQPPGGNGMAAEQEPSGAADVDPGEAPAGDQSRTGERGDGREPV